MTRAGGRTRRGANASTAGRPTPRVPRLGTAAVMLALVATTTVAPAVAIPQQAPNSRVVLDLPAGYTPSQLFSGFQNDELGISYVIMEAPLKAYDDIKAGFTASELAKRGLTDAQPGQLTRDGDYVYMRARQKSPAGTYAKFFELFRTADQTVLVSVNVPAEAVDKGTVATADIERVLAGAVTTERPVVRDLFHLGYLGPFKEAGSIVGTSRLYTLDGRMEPERKGEARSVLLVTPSFDKRPVDDTEKLAKSLVASLTGYKDVVPGTPRRMTAGGLDGVEIEAEAVDTAEGKKMRLYQVLLAAKGGGYFRIIGIATAADAERLGPEFMKIARSFEPTS